MNDIQLVLTSAVVSAAVSSGVNFWGQRLERKSREAEAAVARDSRQKEMFLTRSIDMALDEKKTFIQIAKDLKRPLTLNPDIESVAEIYTYLSHLFQTGDLPESLKLKLNEQRAKIEAQTDRKFLKPTVVNPKPLSKEPD